MAAYDKPPVLPDSESARVDRVDYIVALMVRNEWEVSYSQRKALGDHWGIAEATVRQYSAEAHRLVSLGAEERAQLRDQLAKRMRDIAERAKSTLNEMTGMPDFKAEIEATRLMGEYFGVKTDEEEKSAKTGPSKIVIAFEEAGEKPDCPSTE